MKNIENAFLRAVAIETSFEASRAARIPNQRELLQALAIARLGTVLLIDWVH